MCYFFLQLASLRVQVENKTISSISLTMIVFNNNTNTLKSDQLENQHKLLFTNELLPRLKIK